VGGQGDGAEKKQGKWSKHAAFFHDERVGATSGKQNLLRGKEFNHAPPRRHCEFC
jgi:hypothetical protein